MDAPGRSRLSFTFSKLRRSTARQALLFLLDQARTLDAGTDIGLLDAMWAESPLPDGMDLNIRLMFARPATSRVPKHKRRIDFVLAN